MVEKLESLAATAMRTSTAPRLLCVTHQPTSDPGQVGELLRARGYQLDRCCPASDQPLPKMVAAYAGVIVLGGPMSANDEHLDFIRAELDWIPQVLAAGLPFLGLCLGAQLLARVLGATVAPHPEGLTEIGYFPVQFAASLAGGEPPPAVFHWHCEGFEVPAGATRIATGERFVNQAFRYGDRAYGFQFHPEVTGKILDRWTTLAAPMLELPGAQPRATQFRHHAQYYGAGRLWISQFLRHWLPPARAVMPIHGQMRHSQAALTTGPSTLRA